MVFGMNASKRKGDQGEREAVEVLCRLAPDLVTPKPRRKLGAGRHDDVGDLDVFCDVAVQVKTLGTSTAALRQAAQGAVQQALRANLPLHLGMAPVPRARRDAVRWLAAVTRWPSGPIPADELLVTGRISLAVSHARQERAGIPRHRRISLITRSDAEPIYVAPIEAWVAAYRAVRLEGAGAVIQGSGDLSPHGSGQTVAR
jgi:hypothetical protein